MNGKDRRSWSEMRAHAEALVAELTPHCERIEIAGSIRRGKPTVADIELVAVPRFTTSLDDLFGKPQDALDGYARARLAAGDWHHRLDKNGRPACGARFKRLTIDGVAVDLFVVLPPAQWGAVFMIRTGSGDFSRRIMTTALRCGLRFEDGALRRGDEVIPTPAERDVFAALGVPWIEPARREA